MKVMEDEVGGIVNTCRTRRGQVEKPIPRPNISAVVKLPTAKPPEEKMEEREAPERKISFPVAGFEICPICGQYSKHVAFNGKSFWICKGCDDQYFAYAKKAEEDYDIYADLIAAEILAGKNPPVRPKVILTKAEWILVELKIASMTDELANARLDMSAHNQLRLIFEKRVTQKVLAQNKGFAPEVVASLRRQIEEQIAAEDQEHARKDLALVRYLNTWLTSMEKLKPELERRISEAAKAAAPAPVTSATS